MGKPNDKSKHSDDPKQEVATDFGQKKVQVWVHALDSEGVRKVLLLKTTEERGSFWQPVTGGVEGEESLEDAAARESEEETGFQLKMKPQPMDYDFVFEGKHGSAHEFCFEVEMSECQVPFFDPKEHVEAKWVTLAKAKTLIRFESNKEALGHLVESF